MIFSGLEMLRELEVIEKEEVEAAIGIEPMDKGFADLCLTTWLRRLIVKRKAKATLALLLEPRPSP